MRPGILSPEYQETTMLKLLFSNFLSLTLQYNNIISFIYILDFPQRFFFQRTSVVHIYIYNFLGVCVLTFFIKILLSLSISLVFFFLQKKLTAELPLFSEKTNNEVTFVDLIHSCKSIKCTYISILVKKFTYFLQIFYFRCFFIRSLKIFILFFHIFRTLLYFFSKC